MYYSYLNPLYEFFTSLKFQRSPLQSWKSSQQSFPHHDKNYTTSVTSGAEIAYPSGEHKSSLGSYRGSCCWIFSFLCCLVFCRSVDVPFFILSLSVLLFTASRYPFGIWYLQTFVSTISKTSSVFDGTWLINCCPFQRCITYQSMKVCIISFIHSDIEMVMNVRNIPKTGSTTVEWFLFTSLYWLYECCRVQYLLYL